MNIHSDLIKSCANNDRKAQQQLYQLLLPYLHGVADRYLRDMSFIKDILQESFIKVFRNIDTYDAGKAPFQQWAARIVINTCLNFNRQARRVFPEELTVSRHEQPIDPIVVRGISDDYLLYLLRQLPEGYFEVFNLHVIDGYNHDEIAHLLGITETLSRKRLSRARNWLKNKLHQTSDSPDFTLLQLLQA